jgi:mgtE-like transporter
MKTGGFMKVGAVLKQSLPLIVLLGVGLIFTGTLFGHSTSTLELFPGLIVLIPALIGLRGNINTTLGSRLGSAVHMGLISRKDFFNDEMKENVKASLILSFIMSTIAGILAYGTTLTLGKASWKIVVIAVVAGSIAGVILAFITIAIIMYSVRKGLDPDNVTGPSLSTVGDLITLGCIVGIAVLVGGI